MQTILESRGLGNAAVAEPTMLGLYSDLNVAGIVLIGQGDIRGAGCSSAQHTGSRPTPPPAITGVDVNHQPEVNAFLEDMGDVEVFPTWVTSRTCWLFLS